MTADGLDSAIEDLYASSPQPLPFAPSLEIRAFLLRRERGNLLIYSTANLETDAAAIADLGGVSRQYLNHSHEAMFASDAVSPPLYVHEDERAAVARRRRVRATFSRRHQLDDDFEVIPAPGHTSGATAYLWDTGSHRLLFTGDTVLLSDGDWVAAVLDSSDREAYVESLELLRGLEYDVLVPWAASARGPYLAFTDADDARARIGAILDRVRAGASG
jgi:glyoxylase-like metal-dependent hydrolase (beta-lactamase superfamily II)